MLGLPQTGAALISAIALGLDFGSLDILGKVLSVSPYDVGEAIHLSSSTFLRRKKEGRLQPDESDRLLRFSEIVARAVQLFEGDSAAAGRWLNRPARALGGNTPLRYAQTHVGAQEVEDLIGRLEEGVFG